MSLKVSQLLDGQLTTEQVRVALDELATDHEQRDRLTIYALIGDAVRGNSTPDDAYTHRVLERMRREGVTIQPGYDPLKD